MQYHFWPDITIENSKGCLSSPYSLCAGVSTSEATTSPAILLDVSGKEGEGLAPWLLVANCVN